MKHNTPIHFYFTFQQLLELGDRMGNVTKGLTTVQIRRLPTKTFKSSMNLNQSKPAECSVCFCEYEEGDELRLLPCFHEFHVPCIDKWIKVGFVYYIMYVLFFYESCSTCLQINI